MKLLPHRLPPAIALASTLVVLGFSAKWLPIPLVVGPVAGFSAPVGSAARAGRSSG
ncbi:hypothetical protein ABZ816_05875 [Actinosynnema sp. NPDC047251]|uniref:hypothetical protein n=1 Tax=Saccharothrix espanaensis TaxID=103731 RepID=UPI0002DF64B1|nr:hypothetical protein [Saccharothrix espanaensis]